VEARKTLWFMMLIGTVLCGCSTVNVYKEADGLFVAGNYKGAADRVRTAAEPKIESSHLLNWLYMGSGDFASGNHPATVADFTAAESCLKLQNMQFLGGAFSGSDYLARTYDETMMNFYQALSFLAGGKVDRARVEFNRVVERQGRAAKRNEAKIAEAKAAVAKAEKARSKKTDGNKIIADASCPGIDELEKELAQWSPYADYMNPAAVFMSGAFMLLWGEDSSDYEHGLTYFKRAAGMQSSSAAHKAIEILERKASGHAMPGDRDFVLVLFENGMAPEKEEIRKEIIIPYRYPIHAGISMPKLVHRGGAHERLSLWDGGNALGATETVCDFERVVAKEFAEEFKWESRKAYLAAIVRIGIQIALMEVERAQLDRQVKEGKMSPLARDLTLAASGAVLSAVCSATMGSDLRMWSTLPKNFQAAIVPKPKGGVLSVKDASGAASIAEVQLPKDGPSFVYLKLPTAANHATVFTANGRKE